jgi:hypothetical protein
MMVVVVALFILIVVLVLFASKRVIPSLISSTSIPESLRNLSVKAQDCSVCSKPVVATTTVRMPWMSYGRDGVVMLPEKTLITAIRVTCDAAPRLIVASSEPLIYNFAIKHASKLTMVEFTKDSEDGTWLVNADVLNTAQISMAVFAKGMRDIQVSYDIPTMEMAGFLQKYNIHVRFGPLAMVGPDMEWVFLDCPARPCQYVLCQQACDIVPSEGTPMAGAQVGFFRLPVENMAIKDVVVLSTQKPTVLTPENVFIDLPFEQVQPGQWRLLADYIGNGAVLQVNADSTEEVRFNATRINGMKHLAQYNSRIYHKTAWVTCDC